MKILIYTDVHWSKTSSLVLSRGEKYTTRLSYLIRSMNWIEEYADKNEFDAIYCLGDFFNTATLCAEDVTALTEVKWSSLPHYFVVGNHEALTHDLEFNVASIFKLMPNFKVISTPMTLTDGDTELCFLPYISEFDRKPLETYFPKSDKKRIIFSHNDIAGIQMGPVISKQGFEKQNIEENCNLFLNGHLHNGIAISKKIINIGNFTGQNFGEDAYTYSHNAMALDTQTLEYSYIENMYSFNFYKLKIKDITELNGLLKKMKDNAVVTVQCPTPLLTEVKDIVRNNTKIIASKVISYVDLVDTSTLTEKEQIQLSTDYEAQFEKFEKDQQGNSDAVVEELEAIRNEA